MKTTLSRKLTIVLLVTLTTSGLLYLALTLYATQKYQQEVAQRLNATLATNIVNDQKLMSETKINQPALKALFHNMMVINPSIELYLVDPGGKVVAYSAAPGKVKRESIDLKPVTTFIEGGGAPYPLYGDDPRSVTSQKVFSAAPIMSDGRHQGYLYVVLGGEEYDSAAEMLQVSYIFRFVAITAAVVLLLSLVAGGWASLRLTRRLRRLSAAMQAFHDDEFSSPVTLADFHHTGENDEIDQLGHKFEKMSSRIIEQFTTIKEADSSRREMIANLSHDLKTPLASLQGYLETLAMKGATLDHQERQAHLETSLKHARRLGKLIEELFELATLEDRDARVAFEPFSLAELCQDVTQKFTHTAGQKSIKLDTHIPHDAPFVAGDIGLIERALDNLISNALKFTPEGGKVTLTLTPIDQSLVTTVSDTGLGIPQEELPHIFDRFYRVERHETGAPEGTGLGLAITRRIVQLHGADLTADSPQGEGAVFSFPLALASA